MFILCNLQEQLPSGSRKLGNENARCRATNPPEHTLNASTRLGNRSEAGNREPPHAVDQLSLARKKKVTSTQSKPRQALQARVRIIHAPAAPSGGRSEHYTHHSWDEAIPKTGRQDPHENTANTPSPNSAGCHPWSATHFIFTLTQ